MNFAENAIFLCISSLTNYIIWTIKVALSNEFGPKCVHFTLDLLANNNFV